MNKKLLASSVALCLAAMAGYASAGSVELYARMDMGLNFLHTKDFDGEKQDALSLASSQNSTSRFGLKGKEKFDNGMEVGFKLEANVDGDDGKSIKKGRLFYRESLLYIKGAYGELGMGRMGLIDSGNGTYGLLEDDFVAFGTGWGETLGTNEYIQMGLQKRTDNVITYKSPKIAGTHFFLQTSLKKDAVDEDYEDDVEGKSSATRYFGVGAKHENGPFKAFMTVSRNDWGGFDLEDNDGGDDATTVSAGVMYDFGCINLKGSVQYFDQGYTAGAEGYGYVISATAPLFGGKALGYVGYTDAEAIETGEKIENFMVSAGYEYKLSKTTHVYAGLSYLKQDDPREGDVKAETIEAMGGLVVKF